MQSRSFLRRRKQREEFTHREVEARTEPSVEHHAPSTHPGQHPAAAQWIALTVQKRLEKNHESTLDTPPDLSGINVPILTRKLTQPKVASQRTGLYRIATSPDSVTRVSSIGNRAATRLLNYGRPHHIPFESRNFMLDFDERNVAPTSGSPLGSGRCSGGRLGPQTHRVGGGGRSAESRRTGPPTRRVLNHTRRNPRGAAAGARWVGEGRRAT